VSEEPAASVFRVEKITRLVRTVRAMEKEGLLVLEPSAIQWEDCSGKRWFSKGQGKSTKQCVFVSTFVCTLRICIVYTSAAVYCCSHLVLSTYVCIHTRIGIYIHTYVRTYIRTYIHTHTYLHTYIFCNSFESCNAPVMQEVILILASVFYCIAETMKMDLKGEL
jgi:hypothetical protein